MNSNIEPQQRFHFQRITIKSGLFSMLFTLPYFSPKENMGCTGVHVKMTLFFAQPRLVFTHTIFTQKIIYMYKKTFVIQIFTSLIRMIS